MPRNVWLRVAIGVPLGALASFAAGCVYAYAIWDPPSNDWGNEKTIDSVLLAPVLLVVLVGGLFARKFLRRSCRWLGTIGTAGLVGALIGALVPPATELADEAVGYTRATLALPFQASRMREQLTGIAAQVKAADLVVVESDGWMGGKWFEPFLFRLASFTAKPVFLVETDPADTLKKRLLRYRIAAGPECPPPADKPCLVGTDIPDPDAWPAAGALLHIDEDAGLRATGRLPLDYADFHPVLIAKPLSRSAFYPRVPYSQPYDFESEPGQVWRNRCFARDHGGFPFARGVHWIQCAGRLSLADIIEQMFGQDPAAR